MEWLFWPLFGVLIGIAAAQKRGFSTAAFAIGGALLGPLAFLLYFVTGVASAAERRKKCSSCDEWVSEAATVCPHCQRDLATTAPARAEAASAAPAPTASTRPGRVTLAALAGLGAGLGLGAAAGWMRPPGPGSSSPQQATVAASATRDGDPEGLLLKRAESCEARLSAARAELDQARRAIAPAAAPKEVRPAVTPPPPAPTPQPRHLGAQLPPGYKPRAWRPLATVHGPAAPTIIFSGASVLVQGDLHNEGPGDESVIIEVDLLLDGRPFKTAATSVRTPAGQWVRYSIAFNGGDDGVYTARARIRPGPAD